MTDKLLTLTVRGHEKTWCFEFYGDPQYLDEWREDGLEINEVCNTIPLWVPAWAVRPWCFMQDVFNFKWPFEKKKDKGE